MTPDLSRDHPSHDQLRRFSIGLDPSNARTIEEHVRDCPVCWATLAELPATDVFLDDLLDAAPETSGAPRGANGATPSPPSPAQPPTLDLRTVAQRAWRRGSRNAQSATTCFWKNWRAAAWEWCTRPCN